MVPSPLSVLVTVLIVLAIVWLTLKAIGLVPANSKTGQTSKTILQVLVIVIGVFYLLGLLVGGHGVFLRF